MRPANYSVDPELIKNNIKQACELLEVSELELSRRMDVVPSTIYKAKKGRASKKFLNTLSDILDNPNKYQKESYILSQATMDEIIKELESRGLTVNIGIFGDITKESIKVNDKSEETVDNHQCDNLDCKGYRGNFNKVAINECKK